MVARPDAFFLFFILIPVIYILIKRYRRGIKDLAAFGGKWKSNLLMDVFLVKWFFSSLLFILFIVFSILSLADFTGGVQKTVKSSSGLDIVFAVDISGSMLAKDVLPSRLKRSTDLISALIENLPGERFGLVVFKGSGTKLIPLTEDSSSLITVLPYLNPDLFSAIGSNLEEGIKVSLNTFTSGEERGKIILVFTDGESLTGDASVSVKAAKDQDVDIIIFGTGTTRGTRLFNNAGKPVQDEKGDAVITRLNDDFLRVLSTPENVFYVNSSDSSVLKNALTIIKKQSGSSISDINESRYRLFLSFAVLFLFLYISVRIFPWKNTF